MSQDRFPRGQAAIVSAVTDCMGAAPGFSAMEMAARASVKALSAVNLTPADVDGLFVCMPRDFVSGLALAEYLGIRPRITNNNRVGGSSFQTYMASAALALASGQCDVALVAYGSNQRSAAGKLVTSIEGSPYEAPYKPLTPATAYALAASRHMQQYGTTREQMAQVAVAARQWAQLNPDAFMRDPLTVEECLSARMVSTPLTVRDCCLVTDGAAAMVMTRGERAKDICIKPVYILGAAEATRHRHISMAPDVTVTAAADSGPRAMAQAGVSHSDIDLLTLYDAFTINTILFLEDLGFCPKGEGGRFVEGGRIAPGGSLPVNTNGGGLSCVHPGMYGLFALVEAAQQLMGVCGERQIAGAEIALSHGNGGELSSQATVILGTEAAL